MVRYSSRWKPSLRHKKLHVSKASNTQSTSTNEKNFYTTFAVQVGQMQISTHTSTHTNKHTEKILFQLMVIFNYVLGIPGLWTQLKDSSALYAFYTAVQHMFTFDRTLVITDVTLVWLLPSMNPHVSLEV